jgi:hypothetical protein
MMYAPDAVSRFLWSIGRRAESEFYLGLFRAEAKERFAAIAVDGPVIHHGLDALVVDVRFLSDLGLIPIVVLGLLEPEAALRHTAELAEALRDAEIAAAVVDAGEGVARAAQARTLARAGTIPLVPLERPAGATPQEGFGRLGELVAELGTGKVIFLQRRGGISLDGQPVNTVELNADYAALAASPDVSGKQRKILRGVARLLDALPHRCTFAITSPLDLLRELFTARGAGTLVRRAARIERHAGYGTIDVARLRVLLESAFNRPLADDFFDRPLSRIYLEENYRGVAMVTIGARLGAYMSKFAVDRQAQGEGIGKDVWTALIADHPIVFWRSRTTNPVNAWYMKECDGAVRAGVWQVFWRGVPVEHIPEAVAYALEQPKDFPRA